ncbi:hypothetical protein [Streptomyces sp. PT12]|uniref:fascin domain-containing protein n=1 Tax=Streptomyces sp. PT12 TaxID=1510197 RepID=UPI000DE31A88|nr:hypothetical protein [Streptomyces sp. PT12]RBM20665.1 hypothetical protein DEH69_06745 [Streptomyces sp. PT12]
MRRKGALILTLSGLLTVSALGATTASADDSTAPAEVVPEGWQVVDDALMNELLVRSGEARLSAEADEPEELPWGIQSVTNDLFVTSEQNFREPNTGLLRARSEGINGSWELYDLYWNENETLSIRSTANEKFVAAELNRTGSEKGVLRARSEGVNGGWEQFILLYHEVSGRYAFQSVANGLVVSTEKNFTGNLQNALRARSDWINGSWEEFYLI